MPKGHIRDELAVDLRAFVDEIGLSCWQIKGNCFFEANAVHVFQKLFLPQV